MWGLSWQNSILRLKGRIRDRFFVNVILIYIGGLRCNILKKNAIKFHVKVSLFEWSSHQGNSANSHKGYKHQDGNNQSLW